MRTVTGFSMAVLIIGTIVSARTQPATRTMRFTADDARKGVAQQRVIRQRLFALMMDGGMPKRCPLAPTVIGRHEDKAGGYVVEEISFQSLPGHRAHAWIATPTHRRGRVPAILALHGHGGTGEEIVHGKSLYWYGKALAEMGYAVISPDIGSHDLRNPKWTLMGERTWDAIRCLDYLETRAEVDRRRLGVCGLSLGGETTMYVAAMDPRIKVVDSAGWLTTIENMKNGHCPCWNSPGLEEAVDFSDIFACVAPRPIVFEIGEKERAPGGFPVEVARQAFAEVARAYSAFGAEQNAVLDVHPGGHVFVGRRFWDPLRNTLGACYPWVPISSAQASTRVAVEARSSRRDPDAASVRRNGPAGDVPVPSTVELLRKGEIARRCFARSLMLLDGWWNLRDAETNLYPRQTKQPVWAPADNAADMLPFLFLTAHFVAPDQTVALMGALRGERETTDRVGVLPDWWSIKDRKFAYPDVDMARLIFGAAEYCKDGLIPMTEVLGRGPWFDRMVELMDAVFANTGVHTEYGLLAASDSETNGDLLQALARLHAMTGDRKYWEWMRPIADAFCFEVMPRSGDLPQHRWDFAKHAATSDMLNLNDHGNEIIGGLTEFYIATKALSPETAAKYRAPLERMFRKLLAVARNHDGLWVNQVRPSTGAVINAETPDTWGYALSAMWSFGTAADVPDLVAAARGALTAIDRPTYYQWGGADAYADSIEGSLLLRNRMAAPTYDRWLNTVVPIHLAHQQDDGIVEGWYGDGNSARTWLMTALYHTRGIYADPWREDLRFAASPTADGLVIAISADRDWSGRLRFDTPRHAEILRLPWNYARLNEFPEWFTIDPNASYDLRMGRMVSRVAGSVLREGLVVDCRAGRPLAVSLTRVGK